jgi:hypothetical protein
MEDEPTKIIRRQGAAKPGPDAPTNLNAQRAKRVEPAYDPDKTDLIDRSAAAGNLENRTVLVGRGTAPKSASAVDAMKDPVVAWLVVIDGPGKGNSVRLGMMQNRLGRDTEGNEAAFPFADPEMSRTAHAVLTYDPNGRKDYLKGGDGRNLTYVGGEPVLMPMQLKGGERIQLGQTTVLFVPLCGPDFDWFETEKPAAPVAAAAETPKTP